jgi:hypothetical protein
MGQAQPLIPLTIDRVCGCCIEVGQLAAAGGEPRPPHLLKPSSMTQFTVLPLAAAGAGSAYSSPTTSASVSVVNGAGGRGIAVAVMCDQPPISHATAGADRWPTCLSRLTTTSPSSYTQSRGADRAGTTACRWAQASLEAWVLVQPPLTCGDQPPIGQYNLLAILDFA